jgi:hypothetical protein
LQEQLGHSSIVLTAATYTSVLPAALHKAAEATARLVLDTAATTATIDCGAANPSHGANVRRFASHAGGRPGAIAAHRPSAGHLKRSPAVATARQPHDNHRPLSTQ